MTSPPWSMKPHTPSLFLSTGVASVPFYAADSAVDALPKDGSAIVCYCACPHAESGALAEALKGHGFTNVKVLDEGYFALKDAELPITEDANP